MKLVEGVKGGNFDLGVIGASMGGFLVGNIAGRALAGEYTNNSIQLGADVGVGALAFGGMMGAAKYAPKYLPGVGIGLVAVSGVYEI